MSKRGFPDDGPLSGKELLRAVRHTPDDPRIPHTPEEEAAASVCPSCARLHAELDAARKELNLSHELGIDNQLEMSVQRVELAALRTRLERVPQREPTQAMLNAGFVALMRGGVSAQSVRDVWRAMYTAAIDTAATQGGAK